MSFRQYTKCVLPQNHVNMNQYIQATIAGLLFGGVTAAMAIAAGMPWCALIAIEIGAMVWLIAYCEWWLFDRLICLGDDEEVVGMLVSVEPATGKDFPGNFDTDYSINLLPYPNRPGQPDPNNPDALNPSQVAVEGTAPYGRLIKDQSVGQFRGEFARDKSTKANVAVLHAEFEGAGIRDLQIGATVGYGIAVAALFVCIVVPFPWGAIIAGILALLAFLALLIGGLLGLGDTGSPTDVNPDLGNLHTNTDAATLGADLLYVKGKWIYDSMHEGWNELHPITVATKVGTWDGNWPADIEEIKDKVSTGIGDANSDDTKDEQKKRKHRWKIHPDIDGCDDEDD